MKIANKKLLLVPLIVICSLAICLTCTGIFYINNDVIAACGDYILRDSLLCYEGGQGVAESVSELLGGQFYFAYEAQGTVTDKLVMAENHKAKKDEEDKIQESEPVITTDTSTSTRQRNAIVEKLRETSDVDYLWKNFYIVDSTTSVTKDMFDVDKLLNTDLTLEKKEGKKQILIYHTHGASEYFSDSKADDIDDSVVGVGERLAEELEKKGYGVYHDKTQYDLIDGKLDRSLAYNKSLEGIQKIREKYPAIKVMIDLHRDSVGEGKHTYTTIDGKKCAIVMFFNGMSRTRSGEISYLYNPNLTGNLAFSLQLKCAAMEYYDGFTKPIYLKGYRYNLHLEPRSLLIELGNENNTVNEAKNAIVPLADVLDHVLSGTD